MSGAAPPVSYGRVWALSWPVLLANLSVPLAGAVDTAVVGHLPDIALIGAVGIGALIFGFLYWAFAFLRMGTTGFIAQSFGAGDHAELLAAANRALMLALVVSVALLLVRRPTVDFFLYFIEGEADVERYATAYYEVRIWGAPGALVNMVVLGVLFGLQRMRAALATQLVLNSVNIGLDLVFVVGFGWGVEGVALATAISEYAAAIVGICLVRQRLRGFGFAADWRRVMDVPALRAMVSVSLDLLIRTVLVNAVFLHFASLGAQYGKAVLAANTILIHLLHFLSFGLDGFAHAVEALGGSAYGRRSRKEFDAAVRVCAILSAAVALGFTAVYFAVGNGIVALMTDAEAVRHEAARYLPWMILMPLIAAWSFLLDGIFIGATRAKAMRNAMALAVVAYALALELIPGSMSNHGLWLAVTLFMAARALTLFAWYPALLKPLHGR